MSLNKSLGVLFTFTIINVFFFLFFWQPNLYRESDWLAYYLNTPRVIADVPRVTNDYIFTYTPDDNYGFERHSIEFKHVKSEILESAYAKLDDYVFAQSAKLDRRRYELILEMDRHQPDRLIVILLVYSR